MKFSLFELAFGAALLMGQADAFFRMECRGVTALARIDPLVNPGSVSSHAHTVCGGNAFSSTSTTADLLNSDCTSCLVKEDRSAYWTPTMYFKDASTGELTLVNQAGGMLAYYFFNYSPGETKLTAYPEGFSMIAGETGAREFANNLESKAVGFNCLNYGGAAEPTLFRHQMPEKSFIDANCKSGIRVELAFPSCWDGKDLTGGATHKAHMAYPDSVITGSCPPGFPTRMPGLMYEVIWDVQAFAGMAGTFVFSNGDDTGYGYHGDFISGWKEKTLQKALDTCTNNSGRIQDCPVFNIQNENDALQCKIPSIPAELKSENCVTPGKTLPGNSPMRGEAPMADMATKQAAKPASTPVAQKAKVDEQVPAAKKEELPSQVLNEHKADVKDELPGQVLNEHKDEVKDELPGQVLNEHKAEVKEPAAPTVTAAPVPAAPVMGENQKISTTLTKTVGDNQVVEVLVIEEVVTVTEDVVTMTEYRTVGVEYNGAKARRAHGHARRHGAHHA